MRVGIGGGVMGITLGYFPSKEGAEVETFEAATSLGGWQVISVESSVCVNQAE
jgi:protoporphyrinogen oxidase